MAEPYLRGEFCGSRRELNVGLPPDDGEGYDVVKYDPPYPDVNFTWPAYVEVIDDRGKLVAAHARRFKLA